MRRAPRIHRRTRLAEETVAVGDDRRVERRGEEWDSDHIDRMRLEGASEMYFTLDVPVPLIARHYNVSPRTIYDWLSLRPAGPRAMVQAR